MNTGATALMRAALIASLCSPLAFPASLATALPALEPAPSAPTVFRAVEPCRLIDTRIDEPGRLDPEDSVAVQVSGSQCAIPSAATAAALTIVGVDVDAAGFLTAHATGTVRPETSTLNWTESNRVVANGTIVPLSEDGRIDVFALAAADVTVDVTGYFVPAASAAAGRFVPLEPRRLVDTRDGGRPLPGAAVHIDRPAAVPADAIAIAATISTTESSGAGVFTAWAGGERPLAASLNTDGANQTRTAGQIIPMSPTGFDVASSAGDHVIVDITGYFTGASAPESSDGRFVPHRPTRILDTRDGEPLWPNGTQEFDPLTTFGAAAGSVSAIAANWTITEPHGTGFVTATAARTGLPGVATATTDATSTTIANFGIVPRSTAGIAAFSVSGSDLVVDMSGWFTGSPRPAATDVQPNVEPPAAPTPSLPGCPSTGRAAVADKAAQRFWLCENGESIGEVMPMTTASARYGLPPVGTHTVFAEDRLAFGAHGERLHRFVAFYITPRGNRIAFHQYVNQDPATVGDLDQRGQSAGCFRLLPEHSQLVWDFLQVGDKVVVLTN